MSNKTISCVIVSLLLVSPLTNILGQNLAQKALDDTSFTWHSLSSKNIRIYYQKESYAGKHRMMLMRSVTQSVDEVLALFDEQTSLEILNVFYLESREEMKRIVGRPVTGFANWSADAIFLVVNPDWRSFEKHEFTHIVTMGGWGYPDASSRWMIEGISVYADGWCREYSVDQVAHKLLVEDQLPSLQELFTNYAELGEINAGFYAASFIGYIHKTYGLHSVRKLWLNGTENLERLTDSDLSQIESSWKIYLKQNISTEINVNLEIINEKGCG